MSGHPCAYGRDTPVCVQRIRSRFEDGEHSSVVLAQRLLHLAQQRLPRALLQSAQVALENGRAVPRAREIHFLVASREVRARVCRLPSTLCNVPVRICAPSAGVGTATVLPTPRTEVAGAVLALEPGLMSRV